VSAPRLAERPEIEVAELSVAYGHGRAALEVLDRVSFAVATGSFVTILGPNGCGKSTLLHAIAGLIAPTAGRVLHRGTPVEAPHPSRFLMFQDRTLFPWKTVAQNISFGLRAKGMPARLRARLTGHYLDLVGLAGFGDAYPLHLSGGMRQRAEIARALAAEPPVLLMDEPVASLDALSRELFQEELLRLRLVSGITFIMVTHDVHEAVFLSDAILLMSRRPARIKQIVEVDAGRRSASWRGAPAFAELGYRILSALREEVDPASPRLAEPPSEPEEPLAAQSG
jgi:ABC-type nitrate/sulfonate/bicarbonate transport system ATPase subunit